jgi:hypothetical protein
MYTGPPPLPRREILGTFFGENMKRRREKRGKFKRKRGNIMGKVVRVK